MYALYACMYAFMYAMSAFATRENVLSRTSCQKIQMLKVYGFRCWKCMVMTESKKNQMLKGDGYLFVANYLCIWCPRHVCMSAHMYMHVDSFIRIQTYIYAHIYLCSTCMVYVCVRQIPFYVVIVPYTHVYIHVYTHTFF